MSCTSAAPSLLATDPLQDLPVAFALVSSDEAGPVRRFLKNLQGWGLAPRWW
jgi:hypothetical protein